MRHHLAAISGALFLLATPALAQTALTVIDRPDVGSLTLYGPAADHSFIPAPALPGGSALRITVAAPKAGSHVWDVGAGTALTQDIHAGDPIRAAFWARAQSATATIGASLQGNDPPYSGMGETDIPLTSDWRLYVVDGTAGSDFAASHAGLTFTLNHKAQTVDIGPAYILTGSGNTPGLEQDLRALPISGVVDSRVDVAPGITLAATLHIPSGKGPFPAVMQIAGSGPWGRDPNNPLMKDLLDHGVAVLQYDKRGIGQSTGDFPSATQAQLTDDAGALATWLRTQPGMDARRTGLIGASQGGMIATTVTARDPQVAFMVSLAGPAQAMPEYTVSRLQLAMRDAGTPEDTIALTTRLYQDGAAALRAATSDADAVARMKRALAPYVGKILTQDVADQIAGRLRDRKQRDLQLYDPKSDLQNIHVPALGVFGTMDHQVPAEENAAALRAGLSSNPDVTVVILPGFNHLFQHAKIGSEAEWSTLTEVQGSDPGFLKLVTEWVVKRTK